MGSMIPPSKWFMKFDKTVKNLGWKQSKLDHCIYFLWHERQLQGVLGVHVDDVVLGGRGRGFEESVQNLRSIFPFRKWKIGSGRFCGSELTQCPTTHAITVSQESFAERLEKPKLRNRESPLIEINQNEASSLKSVLGGALWLARETRPDLAVQVSQGQQLLPRPTLGVGNVVRRAKQYKSMSWKILPIPFPELRPCLHTDAAFANAKKQGTQAGYLVGVTTDELHAGKPAPWSPCVWKSYRLKRVAGSTFAGESQVLSDGLGHAEWIACHLAEAKNFDFSLTRRETMLGEFKLQAIVDCKSIYDHLQNFASPGSVSDKRVAIDLVIVRETLARMGGVIRWAPTWLQLADAMTKESPEAMDLLRAALTTNKYHLNNESTMMEAAANQRQVRLTKRVATEGVAQKVKNETAVNFTRVEDPAMVKVPVDKITDEEMRTLFECMVSACVVDGEEYSKNTQQSKSMCKARIAAHQVNGKQFGGEDSLLTFTYTKSTKMIQIHGKATMLDKAEQTLKQVLEIYATVLRKGEVNPLPDGCHRWGTAIKESLECGSVSSFLEELRVEDTVKAESSVKEERIPKQILVPDSEEFKAAVADLCNEGARRLHNFPAWRNKFLQFMLREFNASTDQILELSELIEVMNEGESMDQWSVEGPLTEAKPKARADGYRPSRSAQTKKEF